jgi:hypothetical protein
MIKISGLADESLDDREAASSSFDVAVSYHIKKRPSLWQREMNARDIQKL